MLSLGTQELNHPVISRETVRTRMFLSHFPPHPQCPKHCPAHSRCAGMFTLISKGTDPGNQVRINFYILMVEFQVCPNLPAGLEQIAFPIHSMGIVSKEGGCELLLLNYLSGPQFLHPQKRDVLQDNRKSPSTSDTVN